MSPRRIAALTMLGVGAIYLLRIDDVAGLIKDDAWYILLAKALASGQGYRLISSAVAPILPTVPPGFPALLAPVFWINPSFPGNLVLLKLVSIGALALAGFAGYVDFTRHRCVDGPTAIGLLAIVFLTPAIVFLATSTVMSDCVFLAAQLIALVAIERAAREEQPRARALALAAILTAATYLIRVTGVALIVAALAYFLVRRQFRTALIFAAIVVVCVTPWELYARAHQPTQEERLAHGGSIAYQYRDLVSKDSAAAGRLTPISIGRQVRRAGGNVLGIMTRDLGALLVPMLYRGSSESGEEVISVGEPGRGSMGAATGTIVVSSIAFLVIAIGITRSRAWWSLPVLLMGASAAMIAAVGTSTFRYVIPLTPFAVLYFWRGVTHAAAARIAIASLLVLHVIDHAAYAVARSQGQADWLQDDAEVGQVLQRLADDPAEGGVASTNPALVYLRTGRKGIYLIAPDRNWDLWRSWNIRFMAALQPLEMPARARQARPALTTGRHGLWVVEMESGQTAQLTGIDKAR